MNKLFVGVYVSMYYVYIGIAVRRVAVGGGRRG